MALRFDERTFAAFGSPHRTDDDGLLVECVVDMTGDLTEVDASQADEVGMRVRRTSSRQNSQDLDGLLKLGRKDFRMGSVLNPPDRLSPDLFLCRGGESDATGRHRV